MFILLCKCAPLPKGALLADFHFPILLSDSSADLHGVFRIAALGRTRPDHRTSSDGAGRMSHGPALLYSGEKYGIRILKKFIQITFTSLPSENLWILPQALEKNKVFIIGLLLLVPGAGRSLS